MMLIIYNKTVSVLECKKSMGRIPIVNNFACTS